MTEDSDERAAETVVLSDHPRLDDNRLHIIAPENRDTLFANYDPAAVKAAIASLVGGFAGIDTEQLKKDVREARGQRRKGCSVG